MTHVVIGIFFQSESRDTEGIRKESKVEVSSDALSPGSTNPSGGFQLSRTRQGTCSGIGHGITRTRSGRGIRPFSHPYSHQSHVVVKGGSGDHSVTQFAVIDDENVSALQQITRGGGGLTMASQWKSQFDDSEETDNEWKGEQLQSPEHKVFSFSQVKQTHILTIREPLFQLKCV